MTVPMYLDELHAQIDALGCSPGQDYVVRLEVRRLFWWSTVRAWTYTWPDRPEGTLHFRTVIGRTFRVSLERQVDPGLVRRLAARARERLRGTR